MSDASTTQSVECPICGDEFDPTVAGGWCTNTECGEWQYTEATESEQADDGDDIVSPTEAAVSDDDPADKPDTDAIVEATAEAAADESSDAEPAEPDEEDSDAGETPTDPAVDEDTAADAVDSDTGGGDEADADGVVAPEAADEAETADEDGSTAADAVDGDESAAQDTEGTPAHAGTWADGEAESTEADATPDTDDEAESTEADATPDTDDASAVDDSADAVAADTIDCPDCGVELEADANFCMECGTDVSDVSPAKPLTACPGCDADISPDDNFCVNCGEDLSAHRDGTADDDAADALDALGSSDEPVPESLVLAVEGREIGVDDGEKVGREVRAALMDAGRPEEEAVRIHREHVRFVRETDSFYLLDLGDNPTRLNGRTLTKGDREAVTPGDELELSGVATVEIRAP